jgi:hypothetical protein
MTYIRFGGSAAKTNFKIRGKERVMKKEKRKKRELEQKGKKKIATPCNVASLLWLASKNNCGLNRYFLVNSHVFLY